LHHRVIPSLLITIIFLIHVNYLFVLTLNVKFWYSCGRNIIFSKSKLRISATIHFLGFDNTTEGKCIIYFLSFYNFLVRWNRFRMFFKYPLLSFNLLIKSLVILNLFDALDWGIMNQCLRLLVRSVLLRLSHILHLYLILIDFGILSVIL